MCGEKNMKRKEENTVTGSPPRVRGKVDSSGEPANGSRITPACAGKRVLSVAMFTKDRDHPRVCGEKTKKIP